jgi:hypothetical protein
MKMTTKNADIKIAGYGPDQCPHCGVPTGQSYWTHRALLHSELNPKLPEPEEKKPKKKRR